MNKKKFWFVNSVLVVVVCFVFAFSLILPVVEDEEVYTNAPVYNGSSDTNVSLMVNVYWGTEYIDEMLDIFSSEGVKTTFFVGGSWVEKNPEVLRRIYASGHEIGNHGYFHRDHKNISEKSNKEEITACHNIVKAIIGVDMTLFAPPSGSFSSNTLDIATNLGYNTIMWSKDTIDWRDKDQEVIIKRATENVVGGDLILMHPTKETVGGLKTIISTLKQKGLNVAPVSGVI